MIFLFLITALKKQPWHGCQELSDILLQDFMSFIFLWLMICQKLCESLPKLLICHQYKYLFKEWFITLTKKNLLVSAIIEVETKQHKLVNHLISRIFFLRQLHFFGLPIQIHFMVEKKKRNNHCLHSKILYYRDLPYNVYSSLCWKDYF